MRIMGLAHDPRATEMIEPKPPKGTLPPKEFTPSVRELLEKRSLGMCEGCGKAPATEAHHRLYKSRGGRGNLANAFALCGFGNASGCHGRAHTGEGEKLGWSVPRWASPEQWPAFRFEAGWVLLDNEGGWSVCDPPEA